MEGSDRPRVLEACENRKVQLPDGTEVPQLGQGTWYMGEFPNRYKEELEALRLGISLGMTLIDTAEMYGEGVSERLVGDAIRLIPREKLFLVSKVYPYNAGRQRIFRSCDNSIHRMKVKSLDLYLLHWRGTIPLAETVECMEELVRRGKIKRWGVSNFDVKDMEALWKIPGGQHCAVNQVLYHLGSRGIEYDLLPWMREHHIPVMAYCPLAQAGRLKDGLLENEAVLSIAKNHQITPEQVLLAFVLNHPDMITIPKAGKADHVELNNQTCMHTLTDDEKLLLDQAFPPPTHKMPLEIV